MANSIFLVCLKSLRSQEIISGKNLETLESDIMLNRFVAPQVNILQISESNVVSNTEQ